VKRFRKPSDIKVGVVGYGGQFKMGPQHLEEMRAAGMRPVAVADVDPGRLEVARLEYPGIETYRSLRAMLTRSEVNLITIITPHNTHAKLALQALGAARHVVCEKPLAITTAQCDRMIAAARKNKVVLTTYHNRHWDGCIFQAVKKISSGAIGEVYRIEAHMGRRSEPRDWWRSSKSVSGGILYDWGVHLLEYSLQILDAEIVEVTGLATKGFWAPRTPWGEDTNEDEAVAVVRFSDGKWLSLCVTHLDSNPKRGWLEISGTEGSYIFDGRTWEIITRKKDQPVVTKGKNPPGEGWRFYKNVADHLVKGTELVISPEWARRPIHILDLAGRSARLGKSLKAKYK